MLRFVPDDRSAFGSRIVFAIAAPLAAHTASCDGEGAAVALLDSAADVVRSGAAAPAAAPRVAPSARGSAALTLAIVTAALLDCRVGEASQAALRA